MAQMHVGIDCIHFVHEVLAGTGVVQRIKVPKYDTGIGYIIPSNRLAEQLEAALFCERVTGEYSFGDIAVLKTGQTSAHCGFIAPPHLWHAVARRDVIRSPLVLWQHRFDRALRLTAEGWRNKPA